LGLHNIASVNQKQGKTAIATENYYQALKLRKSLNHSQGLASSSLGLAQCYLSTGQTAKALTHIQEGLGYSLKSGLHEISNQFYKVYSQYFSMTGNNEKALEYYIKYSNGKDSLTEIINHSTVSELQTRFETQQKELTITNQKRHIDSLSKDKAIKDLQIERNRYIFLSFFIIFILLIIVTVGYYKRLKFRTEINNTLEEKNLQLKSLMETRNKLFSIISHDMKNLAGLSESVSGMLHRKYDVMTEDMRKNNARITFETARQNKQLIDNLLQWTLTQGERIKISKEVVHAIEATETVINELVEMAQTKGISFETQYLTTPEVWCDRNMLTTVLRNLIANAIKFSHSGSTIKISISQNQEEALFSVEDSGVGMTDNEVNMLFRNDTNPKEIGHHKEKGTGFGLMICKEFVQINKGRIFAQSVAGRGSTFSFTIPLNRV
jgi:signal transduction histidine kinase